MIPTNNTELTNGAGYITGITSESIASLDDVNITSVANDQILKYDSATSKWINSTGGDAIGNFTLSSSVIDTDDSSAITITPAVVMSSDLNVQNDMVVDGSLQAESLVTTSTGTPTIESASSINLTAADRVTVTQSPINLARFTTTERNALTATNGDMIYNTTDNKFQGYANGAWVNLH